MLKKKNVDHICCNESAHIESESNALLPYDAFRSTPFSTGIEVSTLLMVTTVRVHRLGRLLRRRTRTLGERLKTAPMNNVVT